MSSTREVCVVVADDQGDERRNITVPLRAEGIMVFEATDGAEAIRLVQENTADLLILDAYMPGMNGFLALKTIQVEMKEKAPPVLLVIPNATSRETGLAEKLGARGHLKPPFDTSALLEQVRRLVGSRQAPTLTMMAQRPALTLTESRARDEIVRRVEQLPALPVIVQELIEKVHDSNSRTQDLEEIIRRDQSLAARVLKLVNSSFFRGQSEIRSIGDAVVRLGRNTIQSLALASSTGSMVPVNNEAYGFQPGGLWLHSFSVASTARTVALRVGSQDEANQAFLAGLLHDVGKIVLGMMIAKRLEEFRIALDETGSQLEAESRVFFHSHPEVGDMIGDRWKFPREVRDIIRAHHRPIAADEANKALLAVRLADTLVNRLELGLVSAIKPCAGVAVGGSGTDESVPDDQAAPPRAEELDILERLGLPHTAVTDFETAAREAAELYEVYVESH